MDDNQKGSDKEGFKDSGLDGNQARASLIPPLSLNAYLHPVVELQVCL